MFFDIHTHILPQVDDGSKDLETSIEMLKLEIAQGVTSVILTPHVQSRVQKVSREVHQVQFIELQKAIDQLNLPISIHLGAEILYRTHLEPQYDQYTMGKSNYVLVEFSMRDESPVEEIIYDISRMGYKPIVAHIERYPYLNADDYKLIKQTGALIQVNTSSIMGLDKAVKPKKVLKMIKEGYIDIIASDCHNLDVRKPNLMDCYQYLKKHIDEARLNDLFVTNPKKIIDAMS